MSEIVRVQVHCLPLASLHNYRFCDEVKIVGNTEPFRHLDMRMPSRLCRLGGLPSTDIALA